MVVITRDGRATGIQWIEVKDVAKRPTVHKMGSYTKTYPSQNVKSVKVKKSWLSLTNAL